MGGPISYGMYWWSPIKESLVLLSLSPQYVIPVPPNPNPPPPPPSLYLLKLLHHFTS